MPKKNQPIEVKDRRNRTLIIALKPNVLVTVSRYNFKAVVNLDKSEFCEKCLHPMKKSGSRYQQVGRGSVAGINYTIYKCTNCDHKYEIGVEFD